MVKEVDGWKGRYFEDFNITGGSSDFLVSLCVDQSLLMRVIDLIVLI